MSGSFNKTLTAQKVGAGDRPSGQVDVGAGVVVTTTVGGTPAVGAVLPGVPVAVGVGMAGTVVGNRVGCPLAGVVVVVVGAVVDGVVGALVATGLRLLVAGVS